jgi:hypothetical protein
VTPSFEEAAADTAAAAADALGTHEREDSREGARSVSNHRVGESLARVRPSFDNAAADASGRQCWCAGF